MRRYMLSSSQLSSWLRRAWLVWVLRKLKPLDSYFWRFSLSVFLFREGSDRVWVSARYLKPLIRPKRSIVPQLSPISSVFGSGFNVPEWVQRYCLRLSSPMLIFSARIISPQHLGLILWRKNWGNPRPSIGMRGYRGVTTMFPRRLTPFPFLHQLSKRESRFVSYVFILCLIIYSDKRALLSCFMADFMILISCKIPNKTKWSWNVTLAKWNEEQFMFDLSLSIPVLFYIYLYYILSKIMAKCFLFYVFTEKVIFLALIIL